MHIQSHKINEKAVAEIISDKIIIQNADDALDLMGNVYYQGFDKMIIHQKNITPDVCDLKCRTAAELRRAFSSLPVVPGISGECSGLESERLIHFVYETNKRQVVIVAPSLEHHLDGQSR